MKRLQIIAILIFTFCVTNLFSQTGYQKDSLQIKVYTEIEYVENLIKNIKVKKVFCDYCTENQIEGIKLEAKKRSYLLRNDSENSFKNGKRKLALYIRISKKDFLEMKENHD